MGKGRVYRKTIPGGSKPGRIGCGLDESGVRSLNPVVDGYGVGTSISNARVIDFAMDIIEIEGEPVAKRGKMSESKSVLRCPKCYQDRVIPVEPRKSLIADSSSGIPAAVDLKRFFSRSLKSGNPSDRSPVPKRYETMSSDSFPISSFVLGPHTLTGLNQLKNGFARRAPSKRFRLRS
jgi:hypothetical protein